MSSVSSARSLALAIPVLLVSLIPAPVAWAQSYDDEPPPPFVAAVDGGVGVTRGAERLEAVTGALIVDGDRIGTDAGRLALQWVDGMLITLDRGAVVDVHEPRTLRLLRGRLLALAPPGLATPFHVATRNASIEVREPGRYAVVATDGADATDGATFLGVDDGVARFGSLSGAPLPVMAGQQAAVRGALGARFIAQDDLLDVAFSQWSDTVVATRMPDAAPGSPLPANLQAFDATLRRYGSWSHDAALGYVWYPTAPATWQPFSTGLWVRAGRFGVSWAGADPWSWPTHYYGAWGLDPRGRWYWRPSRLWGPSRVAWAVGPNYVAWTPLGVGGRPVTPWPQSAVFPTAPGRLRGWNSVPPSAFPGGARRLPGQAFGPAAIAAPPAARRLRGSMPTPAAPTTAVPFAPQPRPAVPLPPGYDPRTWSAQPVPSFDSRWQSRYPSLQPVAPAPSPYDRATPFLNPRWTSRSGQPWSMGMPSQRLQSPYGIGFPTALPGFPGLVGPPAAPPGGANGRQPRRGTRAQP